MIGDKLLAMGYSLMILVQGLLLFRLARTWLLPAAMHCLFWFGFTFFPLLGAFSTPVNPSSMMFILLATVAFSTGSLLFDWKHALKRNETLRPDGTSPYDGFVVEKGFWFLCFSSLMLFSINSAIQGFSLSDLRNDPLKAANAYTSLRYGGDIIQNMYSRVGMVFAYVATTLGGIVYAQQTGRLKKLIVLGFAFLPSVFVMLTQSAKGMFQLSLFMFFPGVFLYRIARKEYRLLLPGALLQMATLGLIAFGAVAVSFMARAELIGTGLSDPSFVRGLVAYFRAYSFGHVYAFSDWFTAFNGGRSINYFLDRGSGLGFYTFMAVFNVFGTTRTTPPGVFDEYYQYNGELGTNVYTVYRGLIQDFGIAGTLVFMVIIGALCHLIFYALLTSKRPSISASAFVSMMGFFSQVFVVSMWMWNSVYVSFVVLAAMFFANSLLPRMRLVSRIKGQPTMAPDG